MRKTVLTTLLFIVMCSLPASGQDVTAQTIQAAINALPPTGGTVVLPQGVTTVSSTITINAPVNLVGQGSGLDGQGTIIRWTGGASALFSVSSFNGLALRNFSIDNSGTGTIAIDIDNGGANSNSILLEDIFCVSPTVAFSDSFIRIGNNEYARENKSFGLTTIKDRHVRVKGARLRFRFRGKSGRQHEVDVRDRRIANIVAKCQELPGQELFQYVSDDGQVHDVTSQDVNNYLREITKEDFTAKDFRTWAGTLLAAMALSVQEVFETKKQAKANVKAAICAVSELLGNTPAICRKCYVHPAVLEAYLSKTQIPGVSEAMKRSIASRLKSAEAAVLRFLSSKRS